MEVDPIKYDVGKFYIDDIKNRHLSIKIKEHNTTLSGNIIDSSNSPLNSLEVVLYEFNSNHVLTEIDRTKTDSVGSYKFNNVLIGNYIIKDIEFSPDSINANQILASADRNNVVPWRSNYNIATGYLQNGARLNDTKDKVIFIGGPEDGSASIYVYAIKNGVYDIDIEYIGGLRSFNIDVNRQNTGEVYTTSREYFGKMIVTVNLKLGYNLLKFYGSNSKFAPILGMFSLTIVEAGQSNYNLIKGTLENGATISPSKDVVMNLGGSNNGSVKIITRVNNTGYYLLTIKYRYGLRPFLVDINNISTGEIYTVQADYSGKFSFQVFFTRTFNELKFYGIDNKSAPNLGEFELAYIDTPIKPQPPPITIPIPTTPIPPQKQYNVSAGQLQNRAISYRGFAVYLGGHNNGSSTVVVDVQKSGRYSITLNFENGGRPFKLDVNNKDTGELYITPSGTRGKFNAFIELNMGRNTIKFYGVYSSHASYLGEFTLNLVLTPPPPPPTPPTPPIPNPIVDNYSATKGTLENGAVLSRNKDFVLYLGGYNNGSSTVIVNMKKAGKYNISVDFQNGSRPLKIDVNRVYTGKIYTTPAGHTGKFTAVIDLNAGRNTIKFYGVNSEHASHLGSFTLDLILTPLSPILPAGTYNTASGVFENGADLDVATNFVIYLGGNDDGATKVSANVQNRGTYRVSIKYLAAEADRNLSVDVNGTNSGIYTPDITNGWALADAKTFEFQVVLNSGNNEIKFHGDGINPAPRLGLFVIKPVNNPPQLPAYTFDNLNRLSYSDLVSVIKTIEWSDVPGLFNFSRESYEFFRDDNRVQAIIDELEQSGQFFTKQDEQGIDTLVEFLRAGFYIGYNNVQLKPLDDITYRNKCLPAIKAIIDNSNFALGTDIQDKVVKAVGKLIGNSSVDVYITEILVNVLDQFRRNIVNFSSENNKNSAIFKIVRETNYFLGREITRNGNDPQNTNFYDRIDRFISSVEALAEEGYRATGDSEWLVTNFIYVSANLSKFRRDKRITQRALTNCLSAYPYLSNSYLQALSEIKNNFNSELSDGTTINYNQKIDEAKRVNLPNNYNFDDGKVIIKTGNTVSRDNVMKLYWASKEVRAQFVRVIGNDIPLDIGNADDILTIILYNSPSHYKISYQLYGYSTDNGGIYIEDVGTFFTYDREVPRDSIYSLEELFRHEYTHYLEGRFLVKGIWGMSNFYQGNPSRLTWFTEGTAEFFAGATRKDGIKARETVVRNLSNNINNRLSLNDLFSAGYGSFNFYKYGFAFAYYMYTRNIGQFLYINNIIKADDVTGYENYIQNLRSDNNTNSLYNQTIDDLIQNLGNLTAPFTSNDYLIRHSYLTVNQISNDIVSVLYLNNITTETRRSDNFETVLVRGFYNNGVSIDSVSDWNSINGRLDRALSELEAKGWSGYKTFTAYFTNYTVDRAGNALFDIVFHGILRSY